jgi:hypothetical protein
MDTLLIKNAVHSAYLYHYTLVRFRNHFSNLRRLILRAVLVHPLL